MFDERRFKMFRVSPWIYLLEDVFCAGFLDDNSGRCDRSCYLLWHEQWLDESDEEESREGHTEDGV